MLLFQTSINIFDFKIFDFVAKCTSRFSAMIFDEVENIPVLTDGYKNSN